MAPCVLCSALLPASLHSELNFWLRARLLWLCMHFLHKALTTCLGLMPAALLLATRSTFTLACASVCKSGDAATQVVASDVGATIPGVTLANARGFLLALASAVLHGTLQVGCFAVAVRAAGLASLAGGAGATGGAVAASAAAPADDSVHAEPRLAALLVEVIW